MREVLLSGASTGDHVDFMCFISVCVCVCVIVIVSACALIRVLYYFAVRASGVW